MALTRKILVVDDDSAVRHMIRMMLLSDFEVVATGGVTSAKAEFEKNSHLLAVISDFHMPDGNGVDLYRWIRQRSKVPYLLISGAYHIADAGAGFRFLEKPFTVAQLKEELALLGVQREAAPRKSHAWAL